MTDHCAEGRRKGELIRSVKRLGEGASNGARGGSWQQVSLEDPSHFSMIFPLEQNGGVISALFGGSSLLPAQLARHIGEHVAKNCEHGNVAAEVFGIYFIDRVGFGMVPVKVV